MELYRWIKASERLPEVIYALQSHNMKFKGVPHTMIYVNNEWCWLREDIQIAATYPIKSEQWQYIEWLEKIEQPNQEELWETFETEIADWNYEDDASIQEFIKNQSSKYLLIKK